jgi:hypothetical protein
MSNGSLASSRVCGSLLAFTILFQFLHADPPSLFLKIINMARSPKASIYVYVKFSTDVPYERIQIFEKALREFVKSRPREWANFNGFRATKVLADLGYIGASSHSVNRFACTLLTLAYFYPQNMLWL